jgi:RimJ/RimL family protein N-acetyltransferase
MERETQRLRMRIPSAADFETYRAFYADAEASRHYGGPMGPGQAWRKLAQDIGHWALRGYGMWSLYERDSGTMVGGCGLFWPEEWPRHELTWWILPSFRRKGYAAEASMEAIRFAHERLGWTSIETHMNDENDAARALAIRLGGREVAREAFPDGLTRSVFVLSDQG